MGLEGMSEIHANRSRRFNCLLPAFITCRILIRQDCGYFCGDASFFVIVFVFDINGENISCAKKFLAAKMKCKVNALNATTVDAKY